MEYVELDKLLEYEQPTKYIVDDTKYSNDYNIPVLTAGATFILGYTNESHNIYNAKKQNVIIFDDFTTASKFVDFDFKVKSSAMKILKPRNKDNIKYIYYAMQNLTLNTGLHKRYWISIYSKLKIPKLSVEKQNEIVRQLDTINELIKIKEMQLEKSDYLIVSEFVKLFGNISVNDRNFIVEELRKHLKVIGGYAFKSSNYKEVGIPVLKIGNINSGFLKTENVNYWDEDPKLERYCVFNGDLVISLTGTVGKDDYANVCILNSEYEKYYLNQRNAKLELESTLNRLYITYTLKTKDIKKRLTGISRGVRQANISNEDILKLRIPIPPIELQNKFADFVNKVEEQKELINIEIEQLKYLFDTKMNEYFG